MLAKPSIFNALFLSCGLFLAGPVESQTVAEKAAEIDALVAAADTGGAVAAAHELFEMVWDMTTAIGFSQAMLVAEPASGFGIYNPRPDNKFAKGVPVIIYVEPFGFGYGTPAEGLFSMGFFVDLKVTTDAGEVLGEYPNLTELDLNSRYANREFQANLTYNLDGLAAGRYLLQTTLRDKNSGKIGVLENTIEIVE